MREASKLFRKEEVCQVVSYLCAKKGCAQSTPSSLLNRSFQRHRLLRTRSSKLTSIFRQSVHLPGLQLRCVGVLKVVPPVLLMTEQSHLIPTFSKVSAFSHSQATCSLGFKASKDRAPHDRSTLRGAFKFLHTAPPSRSPLRHYSQSPDQRRL